jgi:hypothetical protein
VDKLETVFDRFHQVEHTDASKKGGTGLGLAICRSIVQQHGGAIWAQANGVAEAGDGGANANGNGAKGSHAARGTTLWVQFARTARATDALLPSAAETPTQRLDGLVAVGGDGPMLLHSPIPPPASDAGMRVGAER